MVRASLRSYVGKPSSAYGWSGGFSPGSLVFAHLWWTISSIYVKYSWKGRKTEIKKKKKKKFYPYNPSIQSMPKGYIVSVGSVCLSVLLSFPPSIRLIPSVNTCYNQVLLQSFLIMFISAATSETIHILYGGTWEGSLRFYIYGPLGRG